MNYDMSFEEAAMLGAQDRIEAQAQNWRTLFPQSVDGQRYPVLKVEVKDIVRGIYAVDTPYGIMEYRIVNFDGLDETASTLAEMVALSLDISPAWFDLQINWPEDW